jgi:hypothetical protein
LEDETRLRNRFSPKLTPMRRLSHFLKDLTSSRDLLTRNRRH